MDDTVTTLTITGYQKEGNKLPEVGDVIKRKYQERIGTCFDHDERGYAIIHTDRPMTGPIMVSECQIQSVEETDAGILMNGYRSVTLNTFVLNTKEA
jgi:hypothetical protein